MKPIDSKTFVSEWQKITVPSDADAQRFDSEIEKFPGGVLADMRYEFGLDPKDSRKSGWQTRHINRLLTKRKEQRPASDTGGSLVEKAHPSASRFKHFSDWTRGDKIAALGLLVGLLALPAAWLAVPSISESVAKIFSRPQPTPVDKSREGPSNPPLSPRKQPVMGTVYDETDEAGQPFLVTRSFEKNEHYTTPAKPRGEGHEIILDFGAPGPITKLDCSIQPGGGGGWTHQEVCTYQGSAAHWEGLEQLRRSSHDCVYHSIQEAAASVYI